jgi:hypothetical protein
MTRNITPSSLQHNRADYVTSAAKAALGSVPFVGSLLAEVAGTVLPNQRIDRITKFAEVLERRLANLEHEFIEARLTDEYFTDLLEEGLRQSARSLTDERRDYIAAIISNSLSAQDINCVESKHLLRILNEVNDIEVVWLRSYMDPGLMSDNDFREQHQNILQPAVTSMGASREEFNKSVLQASYKEHLAQLNLLECRYKIDAKTKLPKYNLTTGVQEIAGYKITHLGNFLLRQVGFED